MAMSYEELLMKAENSQKKIRKEESSRKLQSLDLGKTKKLPRRSVDPDAIQRLLGEKKQAEKQKEIDAVKARKEGLKRIQQVKREQEISRKRKGRYEREQKAREERKLAGNRYDEAHRQWLGVPETTEANSSSDNDSYERQRSSNKEKYASKEAKEKHKEFMKQIKEKKPTAIRKPEPRKPEPTERAPESSISTKKAAKLSYHELLALASNKQKNVTTEKVPAAPADPDRPMSAQEREEERRKQSKEYKNLLKNADFVKKPPKKIDNDKTKTENCGLKNKAAHRKELSQSHKMKAKTATSEYLPKEKNVTKNPQPSIDKKSEEKHTKRTSLSTTNVSEKSSVRTGHKRSAEHSKHKPSKERRVDVRAESSGSVWDRIYNKYHQQEPEEVVYEDDESEDYDSEMDDFIDDSEVPNQPDFGAELRRITNYNPNKYRHLDEEDDACMEASFADMQREEKRSAKAGLKEDLEDIKREEQHKKLKRLRKLKEKRRS